MVSAPDGSQGRVCVVGVELVGEDFGLFVWHGLVLSAVDDQERRQVVRRMWVVGLARRARSSCSLAGPSEKLPEDGARFVLVAGMESGEVAGRAAGYDGLDVAGLVGGTGRAFEFRQATGGAE